jgi:transcriptional regulator with XRE-family HTH domain
MLQKSFTNSGLKQQELAEKLGVHRSVVNRRLQGKSNLTLRTIAEMAWAMEMEPKFQMEKVNIPSGSNSVVRRVETNGKSAFFVNSNREPVTETSQILRVREQNRAVEAPHG